MPLHQCGAYRVETRPAFALSVLTELRTASSPSLAESCAGVQDRTLVPFRAETFRFNFLSHIQAKTVFSLNFKLAQK